jgi:threonine dehydrogenase-like Zn-dependent dehydrogenase
MQALVCRGGGQVALVADAPPPALPPGWARVRVRRAGICHTDLELARGYKGYTGILGHEFVGVVEACPDDRSWEGVRVVGEINAACGRCGACRRGDVTHCAHRQVLGILNLPGAFATHLALPAANLHRVPDSVSDAAAVFTEPLAAALEILEQAHVRPSDAVVVLGDGKLGLLCAQVLNRTGASCVLVGRHPAKLARAAAWGIETLRLAPGESAALQLGGADLVVDCTGRPAGLAEALAMVRPRGTVVLKSTFHGPATWAPADLVVREVTLLGSRCGPFAPALRLLASGGVQVEPLLTATYPLAQAEQAFAHAAQPGVLKVQLICEE